MQRVSNYGSFLQSYALKKTIEEMGHECSFIDIKKGEQIPDFKRDLKLYLRKFIERFVKLDFIFRIHSHVKFLRRFKSFHNELGLNIPELKRYDVVVIGSDEVFNCVQPVSWGVSTSLYGNIPNAGKVITYAGSFGHTTIDQIKEFNLEDLLKNSLNNLSAISVRDNNSHNIMSQLTDNNINKHVDPVLFFNFSKYLSSEVKDKNYIIIYSYPNRIKNKDEINSIKQFAKKKGKKLISIGFYFSWCDKVVYPHPFEVLSYFKNADYVITDTFHGTIMSIKFNRNFCTIVRKSNSQKLTSLLIQFKLESRIASSPIMINNILKQEIDFSDTNQIIKIEKKRSKEYLNTHLAQND